MRFETAPCAAGALVLLLPFLAAQERASPPAARNAPAAPAARAGLTAEQAMAIRTVANPQIGDGFLAWTLVVPRPIEDGPGGAYQHVQVFDDLAAALAGTSGEPRTLVGGKDSAPALAARPGVRSVTFLKPIEGKAQVVELPLAGGEPQRVAATPAVSAYRWRPDGKAFAFTALDPMPGQREAARARGFQPVVVDEDWRHLSLWLWQEGDDEPRQLTRGTTVFHFEWSPDGSRIACACTPRNLVDDSYMFQRLFVLDAATGTLTPLVENPGKLGSFAWSPDGTRLAYVSAADRNDPHAGMLYLVDVGTKEVRPLTHRLRGMVEKVVTTPEGFLTVESIGATSRVRAFDARGEPGPARTFPQSRVVIEDAAVTAGGDVVFVAHGHDMPAELMTSSDTELRRLTVSNPWLADVALGAQRAETFRARDGLPIEGVLIEPVGWREGTRYPFVIVVHGGPEAHFLDGWITSYSNWGQLLAARGYVSWYPNYRASTGYGVEFCKQDHGDPMGKEFTDHLDAIDHFAAQGLIDTARVGIGGGSYGGYTAAWAATKHTDRFAAAVSFVPFTDIRTKWLTTDIPFEFFHVHYQERWPWEQPGLLADRSPLTWATQCRTPLLLLGGTSDPRVHPSQPFMLYRAVELGTDTPVRYVQYPGEGHGNRTNVYRYDYALRALRWFDWYLQAGDQRARELPPLDLDYELPAAAAK